MSTISAGTTSTTALVNTGDTTGNLVFQTNGTTTAMTIDTSQNVGVNTSTPNSIGGNSNAKYFGLAGDGALGSADGRIILSNPRAYASIVANSTTAGRVYFQLLNASGGTTTDGSYIAGIASGSGGASGYGIDLNFYTKADNGASSERMRLDSSGNLGLGVTPSAWGSSWKAIEVGGKGSSLFSLSAGDNTYVTSNSFFNGTNWIYAYTSNATAYNMAGGVHKWLTAPSGTAGNAISFTQAMTLDASGNLLVGATSNAAITAFSGAAIGQAIQSVIPVLALVDSDDTTNFVTWLANSGGTGYLYTKGAYPLVLGTGGTERARIDSSGNLLVGTTGAGGKLTVQTASQTAVYASTTAGTNAAIYAYIGYASSTATPALRCVKYDNNSTTSQVFVQFAINQDGANNGQINANGASAAAFGTYSDERLKENIVNLPSQLSNICALRPVEFDYKDGSGHQIGFIAQEMQAVYPDVVAPNNDEMLMVTGWSKTEARLVKAIQEQQAMITQLQAEVAALKGAQ